MIVGIFEEGKIFTIRKKEKINKYIYNK